MCESNFYTAPNGQSFTSKEVYYKQLMRFASVFLLGPILIYISTFKSISIYIRVTLLLIGITIIFYNSNNYLKEIK